MTIISYINVRMQNIPKINELKYVGMTLFWLHLRIPLDWKLGVTSHTRLKGASPMLDGPTGYVNARWM